MKLATTTGDFADYTLDNIESIKCLKKSGFKYIDYSFGMDYAKRTGTFSEDADRYAEECLKIADELSVSFVQAHSPMGQPIREGRINMDFLRDTARSIEYASKLGIKNIVIHSGYEAGLSKKQCFEINREFYMRLYDITEDCRVNMLTENFNKMCVDGVYWIDSAEDLCEFVDYVNHPMLHACWDTGHGNMQDMPQDEALRMLGCRVWGIHVQDNKGDSDSHLTPFCGSMNLDSLMHGLMDAGYKGYFTFESTRMFSSPKDRCVFSGDNKLLKAPLDLRIEAERLLYKMGKCILSAYDCYEE